MGRRFDKPRRLTGGSTVHLVGWFNAEERESPYPRWTAAAELRTPSTVRRMYFSTSAIVGCDTLYNTPYWEAAREMAHEAWATTPPLDRRKQRPLPCLPAGTLARTWVGFGGSAHVPSKHVQSGKHPNMWTSHPWLPHVLALGPSGELTRLGFPIVTVLGAGGELGALALPDLDATLEPTQPR